MLQRILTPELMDDPGLDPAAHAQALRGLRRLNTLSNASAPVRSAVLSLLSGAGEDPRRASVIDIATGSGDLLVALGRSGIGVDPPGRLVGVDISATALSIAHTRAAEKRIDTQWLEADVLSGPLPIGDQSIDVAVCSLFLHHLDATGVGRVLAEMARVSRVGVVVSDLRRSRTGLVLAAVASRTVTRSPIVHVDAIKSVRAAWSAGELADFARQAGMSGATVACIWPERLLLRWSRHSERA